MIANNVYGGSGGSTEQLGIYPVGTDGRPTGDVIIPDGVGKIGSANNPNACNGLGYNTNITSISYPSSIDLSSDYCHISDTNLISVIFRGTPTFTSLGGNCYKGCTSLSAYTVPSSVLNLGVCCFTNCTSLISLIIQSIASCSYYTGTNTNPIFGCIALQDLQLPQGWNKSILISNGTANFTNTLTHDSILAIFNNLADLTGETGQTLTLGSTNLGRMSEDELEIPLLKNWSVV